MRPLVIIFLATVCYPFIASAQEYFLKEYDNYHIQAENWLRNFTINQNHILAHTVHPCNQQRDSACSTLYYLDKHSGEKQDSIEIKSFTGGGEESFIEEENRYVLAGYNFFNGRKTYENAIIDSNGVHIKSIVPNQFPWVFNSGLLEHQGYYYTYGDAGRPSEPAEVVGYITKWNHDLDSIIWTKMIDMNAKENHVLDLQVTPDGNLAYLAQAEYSNIQYSDTIRGSKPDIHFYIRQMDINGTDLGQYHLENTNSAYNDIHSMLVLRDGSFLLHCYSSDFHPREYPPMLGMVIKVSNDLSQVVWSKYMPYEDTGRPDDPHRDQKVYQIRDFQQCRNGDVLVAGLFEGFNQDFIDPEGETVEGPFILRMNPQTGDILWHRYYLMLNDSTDFQRNDAYRYGWIEEVKEDENGDIYAMGNMFRGLPPEYDQSVIVSFLLKVDENGCMNDEFCDAPIILDVEESTIDPFIAFDPPYPNPVSDYLQVGHIPYDSYKLYDLNGKVVQSGRNKSEINTSAMQRGVYILDFIDKYGQTKTYKIVKQ